MSEELEKLKSLGAQKIYEDTHIPVLHVQAILHNSFDGFSKVQFVGFVSILEREYNLDLETLRAAGSASIDDRIRDEDEGLFIVPKKSKNQSGIYALIAFVIFLLVVLSQSGVFGKKEIQKQAVDNRLIEKVQQNIGPLEEVQENNATTDELNTTEVPEEVVEIEIEKPVESFKIVAKSKVWLGYIDIETNQKKQKTFTGELELDPTKRWLIITGHGYIDMFIDGEYIKMDSRNHTRFLYEDGMVKAITTEEFKKLNRGSKW